jgi:hypothetical protein
MNFCYINCDSLQWTRHRRLQTAVYTCQCVLFYSENLVHPNLMYRILPRMLWRRGWRPWLWPVAFRPPHWSCSGQAVANFTNILWTHLRQYSCVKKSWNLKSKYKKASYKNFCSKKARVKCWWNWHLAELGEEEVAWKNLQNILHLSRTDKLCQSSRK